MLASSSSDLFDAVGAGWNDIAYSFLVCEDGRVYEGRGWNVKGAHTLGYNEIAIGVCIIGDYQSRLPLPAAISATQQLLACGVEKVVNRPFSTPGKFQPPGDWDTTNYLCFVLCWASDKIIAYMY